jgi:glucan biosynthesis protein C
VYILHQTIIIVVAHALKPSDLYPPLEGMLLVSVTAATSFLGYEVIRRIPLLRPLFGLERGIRRATQALESAPKSAAGHAAQAAPRLVHD